MKSRHLLLALPVLALAALFPATAEAQWCQGVSGPYWCGDPNSCLYLCGQPASNCTTACKFGGGWTTCGETQGLNAADYDSDGISTSNDNCPCTANANQANCDGDNYGDICDPKNEKWVLLQNLGRCDLDFDLHFDHRTVEQYGSKKYRNLCGGAICYDRYLLSDADCSYTSSCGSTNGDCCVCNYPFEWCIGGTSCPSPACPF